MKTTYFLLPALLMFVSFTSKKSPDFCACCGEKDQYIVSQDEVTDYQKEYLFAKLNFEKTVGHCYVMTEDITGLGKGDNSAVYASFNSVDAQYKKNNWVFSFGTKDGKKGSLILPLPDSVRASHIDIHEPQQKGEIVLYKDLIFKNEVVAGTGIFSAGFSKPVFYKMVIQGRGNNCDNPEDFKHWRLDIEGENARYSFCGTFHTTYSIKMQ